MKRKIIIGFLVAGMIVALAGCKQPTSNGTAPTLTEVFYTTNNLTLTSSNIDSAPRLSTIEINNPNGDENSYYKYKLVVRFSDPDMDAYKLHFAFSPDFAQDYPYTFTQRYENQFNYWDDDWITRNEAGAFNCYVYIEDRNGNRSAIRTMTLYGTKSW